MNRGGVAGTTTWFKYKNVPIKASKRKMRHGLERRLRRVFIFQRFPLKYMLKRYYHLKGLRVKVARVIAHPPLSRPSG
jgi:hypothetical protein